MLSPTRIDRCSTSFDAYCALRYKASAHLRMLPTSTRAGMGITLAAGVFWAGAHATVLRPGNHLAKIRGRGWKLLARCRIDRQPPAQPWLWRPGYYPLQFGDFALQNRNVLAHLPRGRGARKSKWLQVDWRARCGSSRWSKSPSRKSSECGYPTAANFFLGREAEGVTKIGAEDPTARRAGARSSASQASRRRKPWRRPHRRVSIGRYHRQRTLAHEPIKRFRSISAASPRLHPRGQCLAPRAGQNCHVFPALHERS